jgi:hypothetical protein
MNLVSLNSCNEIILRGVKNFKGLNYQFSYFVQDLSIEYSILEGKAQISRRDINLIVHLLLCHEGDLLNPYHCTTIPHNIVNN